MEKHRTRTRWTLALALTGLLAMGACDDDPVGTDDDHGHGGDVEGVVLIMNGQTLATYDGEDGTWEGELDIGVGEESDHIDVRFVDHDGNTVSFDDEFSLGVEVEDEAIAEFEQDTEGEFGGHLHGKAEGVTDVVFMLMHGNHSDFSTEPVHVHVGDDEHDDG